MTFPGRRSSARAAGAVAAASIVLALLVQGCAAVDKDRRALGLEATTNSYHSAIRWGDFERAHGFLAPDLRAETEIPAAFADLRVTRYEVLQAPVIRPDGSAAQTVGIEYLFEYKQVVRRLTDRQVWRWDEEAKTWWLHSGLPEF